MDALWRRSATDLSRALRAGEVSAREVLAPHLDRMAETNPSINAIVTLVPERAMTQAQLADEAFARGEPTGPLRAADRTQGPRRHRQVRTTMLADLRGPTPARTSRSSGPQQAPSC
jgi:amidase